MVHLSKSSLLSLSPCMLLSDGRELVGKLGPVDDGDDDYEKKDTTMMTITKRRT